MKKLGSLFDGSGGFPLAGELCGLMPIWASEIEPYPIAVTRSRFPNMKHIGDVSKINGAEIEPVDVITFGSPCPDLSVAGKRAGLKHEDNGDKETTRSGLFMEAVRIIKEMRKATNGIYPRFALWENVPGAFSSNKGEDFRIVLEELIKVIEPQVPSLPLPQEGWPYADIYMGDKWSVAYRTLDAQYWGVPQRRRRIYLVADFRGRRAGEVLFKREGLRGYFTEGGTPWQRTAANAERGVGADDKGICIPINTMIATRGKALGRGTGFGIGENGDPQFTISAAHEHAVCVPVTMKIRSGCEGGGKGPLIQENKSATLATNNDQYLFVPVMSAGFKAGQSMAGGIGYQEGCAATLSAQASGTEPTVCIKAYSVENHPADSRVNIDESGKCQTLTSRMGTGGGNVPLLLTPASTYCLQGNVIDRADTASCNGKGWEENGSYTLNTIDRPAVTYCMATGQANAEISKEKCPALNCNHEQPIILDRAYFNQGQNAKFYPQSYDNGICPALVARGPHAVQVRYIVRRLTPTECARLQGFPDKWGHPDKKETLTDDEYRFWLEVRNTHAAINGKAVKEYTNAQMLTWYNKLHTDSAEYKMWGNGIALSTALYVMQGIAEEIE